MSLPPLKPLSSLPPIKSSLPPLPANGTTLAPAKVPTTKASPAKPTASLPPISSLPALSSLPPKGPLPPLKASPLPKEDSKAKEVAALPKAPLPALKAPLPSLKEVAKASSPKAPLPALKEVTKAPSPKAPLPSLKEVTKAPLAPLSPKNEVIPSSPKSFLPPLSPKRETPLPPLSPKKETPLPPLSPKKEVLPPAISLPPLSPKRDTLEGFIPQKSKKDVDYLDTFFGSRNGIYFANPEEEKNFTSETLSYMTSRVRADELTSLIVDRMKRYGEKIPFSIVECCAGIGGNTLSFLDNPNVSSVVSFESDPKRREMLTNNVETYNLKNKFTLKENFNKENFNKENSIDPSSVLFMDPPWLSQGIKGDVSSKDQYILSGIKLGEKTLEEWISSSSAALFVFKLPLGYKLAAIPDVLYEEIPSKKFLIIIARKISEDSKKKKQEKLEKEKKEEREWSDSLKNFLRHSFLPRLNIPPVALDKLVSPDAMKIWEVTFTHESFNPNFGENYEELEISGDANLEMAYMKFITQSYPQMNRSQLSELRTTYLAKGFQSKLAMELGLGTYVRTRFGKTLHVYEDVLEAVFGALDKIGDMVFKFGAGAGLVFNLVVSLYSNVEIKLESTKANPKTQTKEIFERLGFINPKMGERVPESVKKEDNGKTTFTITVPPLGMTILKALGISISSSVIATYTSNTKKVASDNAYRIAVATMNRLGVTRDFIDAFVKQRDLENPDIKPYVQNILGKLKSEGFDNFYFVEEHVKGKSGDIEGVTTGKYIQMIGVRPNGRKEILVMTDEPVENSIQGRQELLLKYKNL